MTEDDLKKCAESLSTVVTDEKLAHVKIMLPVIRRVMPNIIANDIIGVQPMSGPVGQIFKLRTTYGNPNINDNWLIRLLKLLRKIFRTTSN